VRENTVKLKLDQGGVSLGTMVFGFASANVARAAAAAGADFVVFDQEHTGFGIDTIRELLVAARGTGLMPFVRLPAVQAHLIAGVLDIGAMGVMLPMVSSAEQAEQIVSAVRYPPAGRRGFGLMDPDDRDPAGAAETMRKAQEAVLVIVQIENLAGLEAAADIAAVEGIDALWIGQSDLSNALGIPGDFEQPAFHAAVATVRDACERHGKALAIMATSVADGHARLAQGFRLIAHSGDSRIYTEALRTALDSLRSPRSPAP
jgi:2-dehydro-3-deoxyglucarate aldolase/4-hydroxy-2-oxoheptanedioate aldolase